MSIKSTDNQYIAHTYKRFDIAVVKGSGALCWDDNGKKYIDMTSGIGVNAFGYSDPLWAQAVAEQAFRLGVNVIYYAFEEYYSRHYGGDDRK